MLTALAVILVGIWMVIVSQGPVQPTVTLMLGIVVAVLALIDLVRGAGPLLRR